MCVCVCVCVCVSLFGRVLPLRPIKTGHYMNQCPMGRILKKAFFIKMFCSEVMATSHSYTTSIPKIGHFIMPVSMHKGLHDYESNGKHLRKVCTHCCSKA